MEELELLSVLNKCINMTCHESWATILSLPKFCLRNVFNKNMNNQIFLYRLYLYSWLEFGYGLIEDLLKYFRNLTTSAKQKYWKY